MHHVFLHAILHAIVNGVKHMIRQAYTEMHQGRDGVFRSHFDHLSQENFRPRRTIYREYDNGGTNKPRAYAQLRREPDQPIFPHPRNVKIYYVRAWIWFWFGVACMAFWSLPPTTKAEYEVLSAPVRKCPTHICR